MKFLAAALLASSMMAANASATVITVNLTGTVDDNTNLTGSGYAVGDAINGSFSYNTLTNAVTAFNVGRYTLGGTFTSSGPIVATRTAEVAINALQTDASGNTTGTGFALDLYYANPTANTTDLALFFNSASGFLNGTDPITPSTFSYATPAFQIEATINTLAAPEPATMALFGTAGLSLLAARRRR